ncbi:MAG: ribbon-helix-helix protein, CopG family [Mycobacteriales bacterium]
MAMTLRLDETETEALRQAAEAEGVSMQELARKAIREYTIGWASRRDAYMAAWADKNASLLRRLGE